MLNELCSSKRISSLRISFFRQFISRSDFFHSVFNACMQSRSENVTMVVSVVTSAARRYSGNDVLLQVSRVYA